MKLNRVFVINLMLVVGMLALSIWTWWQLPPDAKVATHFNFDGTPSSYMDKTWGLFILPAIALILVVTNRIIPNIEPNQNNIKRSQKAYTIFSLALIIFLSVVHGAMLLFALGKTVDMPMIVILAVGILTIVLGNYLSKIRRNYSFGVRTPWTLSSDLAWHKTHRLASWLTVLHGIGLLVSGLRSHTILPIIVLISFAVTSVVILPIYSYICWRSDDRRLAR